MVVFINVGTYRVGVEKREEFLALMKKISDHMKSNPGLFEPIKSHKLYSREFGGMYGEFVDMWEFESWVDYQDYLKTYTSDKTWAELWGRVMGFVEPSAHVWENLTQIG